MGTVFDIAALLIVVLCATLSAKHGFIRTLTEVAGFIAAVIITFNISTPLATATYSKFIEPSVISAAETAVSDSGENASDAVWSALPKFITRNGDRFGITKENISGRVDTALGSDGVATAAKQASQSLIMPAAVKLLGIVYSVVIFIVFVFLVKIIAKYLNKLFSFSVIGSLNRMLGGVLGVFKGLIIVAVLCIIMNAVIFATGGFSVFTPQSAEASFVCRTVSSFFSIL